MKFLILFLLPCFFVIGQSSDFYEGKIILKNGSEIIANSIKIENNVIKYIKSDNATDSVSRLKVRVLKLDDGNLALEGAGLGVAFGFLIYINSVKRFENMNFTGVSLSLGLGAAFGFAVGLLSPNVKTIQFDGNSNLTILNSHKFLPYTNVNNISLITYNFNF